MYLCFELAEPVIYSYEGSYCSCQKEAKKNPTRKSSASLRTGTPPPPAARVAGAVMSDFGEFLTPTHHSVLSGLGRREEAQLCVSPRACISWPLEALLPACCDSGGSQEQDPPPTTLGMSPRTCVALGSTMFLKSPCENHSIPIPIFLQD